MGAIERMQSTGLKRVPTGIRVERAFLPVSEDTLTEVGWRGFYATTDIDVALLGPLLRELRDGDSVHSWKTPLALLGDVSQKALVRGLLEAVHSQRPTTVFMYVGERVSGEPYAVGFAAVSERIAMGFPHDGFPVLARAFIRPDARGHGLYPAMVRHRIGFCRDRWGADLRAIHLGSADPVVWRTVQREGLLDMPFLYLGDEELDVVGSSHEVRDYLAFSRQFVQAIGESVRWSGEAPAPRSVVELAEKVAIFLRKGATAVRYPDLVGARDAVVEETGWDPAGEGTALREFLDFCAAVPVIR